MLDIPFGKALVPVESDLSNHRKDCDLYYGNDHCWNLAGYPGYHEDKKKVIFKLVNRPKDVITARGADMDRKDFCNRDGVPNPTAYFALKSIERDEASRRLNRLIKTLKAIIAKSGFTLINNIELRDVDSGIIFRGPPRRDLEP